MELKVILDIVDADLLEVPTKSFSDTSHYTKSTVRPLAHVAVAAASALTASAPEPPLLPHFACRLDSWSKTRSSTTCLPEPRLTWCVLRRRVLVRASPRARVAATLTSLRHWQSKAFEKGDVVLEVTDSPSVKLLSPLVLRSRHPA